MHYPAALLAGPTDDLWSCNLPFLDDVMYPVELGQNTTFWPNSACLSGFQVKALLGTRLRGLTTSADIIYMNMEQSLSSDLIIVCISDTHGLHRELEVPHGDVLIHAGDFTCFSRSQQEIKDFNIWLGELPHRHKIVVPGNHDFFLEADSAKRQLLTNATLLIDEFTNFAGLKVWGSPVTRLSGGGFGRSLAEDCNRLYTLIPDFTDIVVTHGPPFGILDSIPGSDKHQGCPELLERVEQLKPKLHVFGHVHSARGIFATTDTLFVNAALLGANGDLDGSPIVVRISRQ